MRVSNAVGALAAAALLCQAKALRFAEFDLAATESHLDRLEQPNAGSGRTPVVVAHGMGDSCFNPGMRQITGLVGKRLGAYSVCIGDGDNMEEDTVNGFFTTMDEQVDFFHAKVRADAQLRDGFDAIGLSQGNLVIRAYIHKYNDPPVRRFLSIHGPLAGVGSLPRCDPDGLVGLLCRKVTDLVGDFAYTAYIQSHIAQANYLKDPTELKAYTAHNPFLPFINNEVKHKDADRYRRNFESLELLLLVKARGDTMIFPRESEWFGYFEDGDDDRILPFNETQAFKTNAFGLRTLVDKDKVRFLSSRGNHLQFSMEDLYKWLDEFF